MALRTWQEVEGALAAQARVLGAAAPTSRMVRDWVDEGLVPPRIRRGLGRGRGVTWMISDDFVHRAKLIVRAKSRGVVRMDGLRLTLWAQGCRFPEDQIRSALKQEYERAIRSIRKSVPDQLDLRHKSYALAPATARALLKLGALDPRFAAAGFGLPDELRAVFASLVRFGSPENEAASIDFSGLTQLLQGIAPGVDWTAQSLPDTIGPLLAGSLGVADETDPDPGSIIQDALGSDIRQARVLFRLYRRLASTKKEGDLARIAGVSTTTINAYGASADVIMDYPWLPFFLYICLQTTQQIQLR